MSRVNPPTDKPEHGAGDVELMQLVAANDAIAERTVVDRLMARVRRATGALLRNQADADDAAQLCMLELLRSAGNYSGRGSLEAWCDRIVVRTTLRFAKSQAKTHSMVDGRVDPDAVDAGRGEPRLADEVAGDVSDYLARLSEDRRTVLVLRHVLGHSVDEIAELTGVSRNTVKDRLLTARQEFRRMVRRGRVIGSGSGSRRTA
jgi:RNA polymerase sigma-70 factor (ECF subfamily)